MALALFPELPEITEVVQNPTAADYAEAARYALKRNQLKLAVQQVAGALTLEPAERSHRHLLNEIVSRARDPLQLLELESEGVFYGIAAARAWFLASNGKATAAVEIMQQVVSFRPNVPLLLWTEEWATRPGFTLKVDPDAVASLLRELLKALREASPSDGQQNLASARAFASLVAASHPDHAPLRAARSQLLRECGEPQQALALALAGADSIATLHEAASACAEIGRTSEQLALLRRAVELGPNEPETHRALGRALVPSRELAAAEAAFACVPTGSEGGHPSPGAPVAYLRWLRDGDRSLLDAFEPGAAPLTRQLLADSRAYDSWLPDPLDPVTRVIRDAIARARRDPPGTTFNAKVRVDGSGTPSALLAFRLGLSAIGQLGTLTLTGDSSATRLGGLWQLGHSNATPLVAAPSSETTRIVEALARGPFDWTTWNTTASAAPPCEPSELLAAAVHPPVPPPHLDAVEWLVRIHTAVGLLLAHHPAPWAEREPSITRALAATDDWICALGIVAWCAAAQRDPALCDAARSALAPLLPEPRATLPSYARALAILGSPLAGPLAEAFRAIRACAAFSA